MTYTYAEPWLEYIPFRRWVETILWILCRGPESTPGTMLYPHIGAQIFNSIQTNVGQIYVHYLERGFIKGLFQKLTRGGSKIKIP